MASPEDSPCLPKRCGLWPQRGPDQAARVQRGRLGEGLQSIGVSFATDNASHFVP